jgi:hypothetical protein
MHYVKLARTHTRTHARTHTHTHAHTHTHTHNNNNNTRPPWCIQILSSKQQTTRNCWWYRGPWRREKNYNREPAEIFKRQRNRSIHITGFAVTLIGSWLLRIFTSGCRSPASPPWRHTSRPHVDTGSVVKRALCNMPVVVCDLVVWDVIVWWYVIRDIWHVVCDDVILQFVMWNVKHEILNKVRILSKLPTWIDDGPEFEYVILQITRILHLLYITHTVGRIHSGVYYTRMCVCVCVYRRHDSWLIGDMTHDI